MEICSIQGPKKHQQPPKGETTEPCGSALCRRQLTSEKSREPGRLMDTHLTFIACHCQESWRQHVNSWCNDITLISARKGPAHVCGRVPDM